MNGLGLIGKIERQEIGVGKTHHRRTGNLRERFAIGEVGVAEVRVPIKIVVDRVIDAALIFATEAIIQHRDAKEILRIRHDRSRRREMSMRRSERERSSARASSELASVSC